MFARNKNKKNIKENLEKINDVEIKKLTRNQEKQEKKVRKKRKILKILIFFIIIIVLILGIKFGFSAHKWKVLATEMLNNENSVILDTDKKELAKLGSEKKSEKVSLSDIPQDLRNAYVSIEDERYYKHGGVDIKRTGAAIVNYILHFGSSSYGGSTITQQLVKNMTGDSTDSVTRKMKEWWKAWQLESFVTKDQILECYLNIIYVGPNMYGVQTGAKYYFSKPVQDLNLEECAFLAAINNSPNSYNPFNNSDNTEKITKRTKTVLGKMKELNYIDENEYNNAISNVEKGLNFKKGEITCSDAIYSYHTDAVISEVIKDIAKKYKISDTFATNYLNMANLTIYSTQNSKTQKQTETEFEKSKYSRPSKTGGNSSQAAMVIIDHKTGYVVACVGGLGKKETSRSLNRATQSVRQTGSSIKPIAVLAPAIDKKIITAASVYDDTEKDFADGYHPTDYSAPLGEITVRRAVESSQNIPFVEIMSQIKPKKAISYLKKMGITTLTEEDNTLVLALGGLQKGISPLEMAGAYATIANNGKYIEPTFYSEIINKNGEQIIKSKQKTRTVFSKDVAYILKSILTQPVVGTNGTATYCKISGVDVAAKTGTTDENYDRWLCGFTPYYTAVTWYGYDKNETVEYNKRNPAGLLWANIMSRIHTGLKGAKFEKTTTIQSVSICSETGKKATTGCPNTYIEHFLLFTVPTLCDKHNGGEIDSSKIKDDTQDKVQEIVEGITHDIDAEDPQENYRQSTNTNTITNTTKQNNTTTNSSSSSSGNTTNTTRNTNTTTKNTTRHNTSSNTTNTTNTSSGSNTNNSIRNNTGGNKTNTNSNQSSTTNSVENE